MKDQEVEFSLLKGWALSLLSFHDISSLFSEPRAWEMRSWVSRLRRSYYQHLISKTDFFNSIGLDLWRALALSHFILTIIL